LPCGLKLLALAALHRLILRPATFTPKALS